MSQRIVAASWRGSRTGRMSCQASYKVGRMRSFMAASTMTKVFAAPGFTRMTSLTSTPASPTRRRPGSKVSSQPSPSVSLATTAMKSAIEGGFSSA